MPTKLLIDGGAQLNGTIIIDSSKNALLPIIAATLLVEGVTVLRNVPKISDIENIIKILASLGAKVLWVNSDLHIDCTSITSGEIGGQAAAKIRGSIFVLGAALGRLKTASIIQPGGCAIGSRPIDLHIQGLRDIGVNVTENGNKITCVARKNTSCVKRNIYLDFPSVGATENLIMASVLGKGSVRIIGAAREPEVVDLCNFLNACGASICGHGSSTITVSSVSKLTPVTYTAIPDRINTGSYLIAVAACGGTVTLQNTVPAHNENLISKLVKLGCNIKIIEDKITITAPMKKKIMGGLSVQTAAFPGFPTDLQSQLTVLLCLHKGRFTVTENLFENRFQHVPELRKLGACIAVEGRSAILTGVKGFLASNDDESPTVLTATDLRGGVALVIAALAAKGTSIINKADYIYRGHEDIMRDLVSVGANIIAIE